jgi:hypothetical protein
LALVLGASPWVSPRVADAVADAVAGGAAEAGSAADEDGECSLIAAAYHFATQGWAASLSAAAAGSASLPTGAL